MKVIEQLKVQRSRGVGDDGGAGTGTHKYNQSFTEVISRSEERMPHFRTSEIRMKPRNQIQNRNKWVGLLTSLGGQRKYYGEGRSWKEKDEEERKESRACVGTVLQTNLPDNFRFQLGL